MAGGIFSWHTLGPLVTIEHRLNATAYLSIVADHVHPFMTTVYPSSDGYFQQDNAPCHKAQIISDWFLEHDNEFTLLKWPPHNNLVSEKKWLKKVKVKKISSIICANTTWFDMLLSKCSLSIQIVFWGCQYICLCFLWFVCRSAVGELKGAMVPVSTASLMFWFVCVFLQGTFKSGPGFCCHGEPGIQKA